MLQNFLVSSQRRVSATAPLKVFIKLLSRASALVLLFAVTTFAQRRYIVPVFTTELVRPDATYRSTITVTNLGRNPVHILARTLENVPTDPPCFLSTFKPIPPGEAGILLTDFRLYPHCSGRIFTVVFEADEPLHVRSQVESVRSTGECLVQGFQEIPVATEWLPANTQAVIPTFEGFPDGRSNLFIANPNTFPIEVFLDFQRDSGSRVETNLYVLPESVRVHALPELPEGYPCGISPCPTVYRASLTATGPFYAGISTVFLFGGEVFFPAVATSP
jgi:hypothetical protein